MNIIYRDIKELPNDQLHELFVAVGWSKNDENEFKLNNFNKPFINSNLVFSAWDGEKLVGCIRVISDKIIRSHIHDLAVLPAYQRKGIGTELFKRCYNTYPKTEWSVPTCNELKGFYTKLGFSIKDGITLAIPCKWF